MNKVKYCVAAWYFTCCVCGEAIPNPYDSEMWTYSDCIGMDWIARCDCGAENKIPKTIDEEEVK